jgi:hypothetical protein
VGPRGAIVRPARLADEPAPLLCATAQPSAVAWETAAVTERVATALGRRKRGVVLGGRRAAAFAGVGARIGHAGEIAVTS